MKIDKAYSGQKIIFYKGFLFVDDFLIINTYIPEVKKVICKCLLENSKKGLKSLTKFQAFEDVFKKTNRFLGYAFYLIKDQNYENFYYYDGRVLGISPAQKVTLDVILGAKNKFNGHNAFDTHIIIEDENIGKKACLRVFAYKDGFFFVNQGAFRLAKNFFHIRGWAKNHPNPFYEFTEQGLCLRDEQDFYFFIKQKIPFNSRMIHNVFDNVFTQNNIKLFIPKTHHQRSKPVDLSKLRKKILRGQP